MHSLNKLGDINRSPPILSQVLRSRLCNFIHNDCWELSRPKSNQYLDSIIISCAPTRLQIARRVQEPQVLDEVVKLLSEKGETERHQFVLTYKQKSHQKQDHKLVPEPKRTCWFSCMTLEKHWSPKLPSAVFFLPCNLAHTPMDIRGPFLISAKSVWRGQTVVWQLASWSSRLRCFLQKIHSVQGLNW